MAEEGKEQNKDEPEKKKKKGDNYFGPEQEQAVVDFINTEEKLERDKIYNRHLKDAFNKMIESIIRRYNLQRNGIAFEELHQDALSFLLLKFHKFNPETGKKAYSYYGTIIKRYLQNLLIGDQKKLQRSVQYEDVYYTIENEEKYSYRLREDEYTLNEFLKKICDEIKRELNEEEENKVDKKLTENEKKVGYAVLDILENWEVGFDEMSGSKKFNKMAILSTLRTNTGLSTKDIRVAMKRFKSIYYLLKKQSMDEGLL